MKVLKKILKVFAIIAAIAGAAAAIYFAIQKLTGGKSAAACRSMPFSAGKRSAYPGLTTIASVCSLRAAHR